jgi:beta-phosphoglucomutase-like phosphatase (HAD superfamily)
VIFDCDGVLVDSEVIAMRVECEELGKLGLHYSPAEFCRRFMGLTNREFFAELDRDRRARMGRPLPDSFVTARRARLEAAFEDCLVAVEGAREAVMAAPAPVAVASSSGQKGLEVKLGLAGLRDLFDPHIYGGDRVPRGKPDPDLFLLTARELGAPPARCLVVEDSLNGIAAGLAAGMTVWGFTGGGHADVAFAQVQLARGAQASFGHWDEVRAEFETWTTAERLAV